MNMAREEGEGMETTETESGSPAGAPPPSLEQLLTSPDPKHGNIYILYIYPAVFFFFTLQDLTALVTAVCARVKVTFKVLHLL